MAGAANPSPRRGGKSAEAFRTISEVADTLEVPQHVLRFWESKFSQVRPLKRGGGRRYYRPEDVELLLTIRGLLYDDGYTIKGVQKLLRDGALKKSPSSVKSERSEAADATSVPAGDDAPDAELSAKRRKALEGLADELETLKDMLDKARD